MRINTVQNLTQLLSRPKKNYTKSFLKAFFIVYPQLVI